MAKLFESVEDVQTRLGAEAQQQAALFGQLGVEGNLIAQSALAGSQLGSAGASMLGFENKQVQKAKALEAVQVQADAVAEIKGLDIDDPEYFSIVAQMLADAGFRDEAMQALEYRNAAAKAQADVALTKAQREKAIADTEHAEAETKKTKLSNEYEEIVQGDKVREQKAKADIEESEAKKRDELLDSEVFKNRKQGKLWHAQMKKALAEAGGGDTPEAKQMQSILGSIANANFNQAVLFIDAFTKELGTSTMDADRNSTLRKQISDGEELVRFANLAFEIKDPQTGEIHPGYIREDPGLYTNFTNWVQGVGNQAQNFLGSDNEITRTLKSFNPEDASELQIQDAYLKALAFRVADTFAIAELRSGEGAVSSQHIEKARELLGLDKNFSGSIERTLPGIVFAVDMAQAQVRNSKRELMGPRREVTRNILNDISQAKNPGQGVWLLETKAGKVWVDEDLNPKYSAVEQ